MLNKVVMMGRLTKNPELRRTGGGVAVTSFTIAVDRDFAEKQSGQKETDFVDCVAWRQTGEFVDKYFSKGKMIVVSGRLQKRSWTDKDGNKRSTYEVVADDVYFGDSKKETETPTFFGKDDGVTPLTKPVPDFAMIGGNDYELPF